MSRQIALLRGINVGGHNSFPKAKQLELAESLGFGEVSVLLQTGNIVFADPGIPRRRRPGCSTTGSPPNSA